MNMTEIMELISKTLPSFFAIFILKKIIKLRVAEQIYIYFMLCLFSNLLLYVILLKLGYVVNFTVLFSAKYATLLIFVNLFLSHLFILLLKSNKK